MDAYREVESYRNKVFNIRPPQMWGGVATGLGLTNSATHVVVHRHLTNSTVPCFLPKSSTCQSLGIAILIKYLQKGERSSLTTLGLSG